MTFLTDFADQAVLLPVAAGVAIVLVLLGWLRGAMAWTVAVCGTLAVMLGLKMLFTVCGPAVPEFDIRTPSGHVAAAAVIYGGLAALFGLRPAMTILLSIGVALLVAVSRVTLEAHTPSEAFVGGLVGCAGAATVAILAGPKPPGMRHAPLIAVPLLLVVLLHGVHLHAEPTIGRLAHLLDTWPFSACAAAALDAASGSQ
ncbi:MAG: phosphatase PAP2 family protein [Alphaproteobacteria bacterium]|nr:phosphatase PAP2 family protein [Alphaproteobacteria bacterium]